LLGEGYKKPKKTKPQHLVLDSFEVGSTFEQAVQIYVFDKKLRLLLMDALERIEIALRVDVSHTLGQLNKFAYLTSDLFHPEFSHKLSKATGVSAHHEWLSKHATLINRSKEEFVKHNKDKYGLPLAIWVACEVWDFGTLSKFYAGMRESEQDVVSNRYGVKSGRIFATWLRSLNYLRNICAHHSRLWNRNIIDQPSLPNETEVPWVKPFLNDNHARARCFLLIRIALHLLRVVNPNSTWGDRMRDHILSFPLLSGAGLDVAAMGVPTDWQAHWGQA
jgi:abortive infection bacteriophage resistance protein